MYNFHVEELHRYAVGTSQVLVHNNSLAENLEELMKAQNRYEQLMKDYKELRALEEADPYTNYYVDDLIEELENLRRQRREFK